MQNVSKHLKALLPQSTPDLATKSTLIEFYTWLPSNLQNVNCDRDWCITCNWYSVCNGSLIAV